MKIMVNLRNKKLQGKLKNILKSNTLPKNKIKGK